MDCERPQFVIMPLVAPVVFAATTRWYPPFGGRLPSMIIATSTLENPVARALVVNTPPSVEMRTTLFAGTVIDWLKPGISAKALEVETESEAVPKAEELACPVVPSAPVGPATP
jgi:hypothetical protein